MNDIFCTTVFQCNILIQSIMFRPIRLLLVLLLTSLIIILVGVAFRLQEQCPGHMSLQKSDRFITSFPLDQSLPIPSVILRPSGGIGNQLFRFSATYSLARRLNTTLFIQISKDDKESLQQRQFSPTDRFFALDYFHLNFGSQVQYLDKDHSIPENRTTWITEVAWARNEIPSDSVLISEEQEWESELFFQDYRGEILQQFELINGSVDKSLLCQWIREITSTESVAVHFRRGDFVQRPGSPDDWDLPATYQKHAMQLVKRLLKDRQKSLTFFVFSDDIEFVKEQLKNSNNASDNNWDRIVYVSTVPPSQISSLEDFYLMHLCKHQIVPNSTFSWWAAYLNRNKDKIVIAPFPRHHQRFYERFSDEPERQKYKQRVDWNYPYPKDWITLNPFENFEEML